MTLFAKWFFGFSPETFPLVTFTHERACVSLIHASSPGDRIVFVMTGKHPVLEQNRGKILGMAEIDQSKFAPEEIPPHFKKNVPPEMLNDRGEYRWSKAIPMIRAWRFTHPPQWRGVLGENWRKNMLKARTNAIRLDKEEKRKVLVLECEEITLGETPFRRPTQGIA